MRWFDNLNFLWDDKLWQTVVNCDIELFDVWKRAMKTVVYMLVRYNTAFNRVVKHLYYLGTFTISD